MFEGSGEINFSPLFAPSSIAIAGASAGSSSPGNRLVRILRAAAYPGKIFILHPEAREVEGIETHPSFQELPEEIDYAFVCVAAKAVPDLVKQAHGKVRFMQVMTSGFGETAAGTKLEQQLKIALANSSVRLLGPNCIGLHSGNGKLSFIEGTRFEDGGIAIVSQSGGFAIDALRRGQQMGLEFSSIASVGNCLDIDTNDILAHHLSDSRVKVVGLYVENIRNGRMLFELLRKEHARIPVVILKGGMTGEGSRAAALHTGAIASDKRVWQALARQTGALLVDDMREFLNLLAMFQFYPQDNGTDQNGVVLVGNGGGAGVVATDQFARKGFALTRFSDHAKKLLDEIEVPAGVSLRNPIDVPANAMRRDGGAVLAKVFDAISVQPGIGAVVLHMNLTVFAGYDSDKLISNAFRALEVARRKLCKYCKILLVARADHSPETAEQALKCRKRGAEAGIPVFDELADAASVLGAYNRRIRFRKNVG